MDSVFSEKVSRSVVDAWLVKPPCDPSGSHPFCHVQCPYSCECFSNDDGE